MKKGGISRDLAVEAFLDLLEEGGRANFRGVAAKLGCAHTNLYNFFQDWDGLRWAALGEVACRMVTAMEDGLDAAEKPLDPEAAIGRYIRFALSHPAWYRLVWFEALGSPMPPEIEKTSREAMSRIAERLAEGLGFEVTAPGPAEGIATAHDLVHGALAKALSARLPAPDDQDAYATDLARRAVAVMRSFSKPSSGKKEGKSRAR